MTTSSELESLSHEELVAAVRDLQMTVEVYQGRNKELEDQLAFSRKQATWYSRQIDALTLDIEFLKRSVK